MNFNVLRSIIASYKTGFEIRQELPSFRVFSTPMPDYVEPTFTKVVFESEKPAFLLVSAVGASGKSMLAKRLSLETGLPILDLGKHPPVADNSMTGILTTAFARSDLSGVFSGISEGTFGVIVDGVDEGRSKAHEKPFEAFLDDLIKLASGATRTSFVLLGRTKSLEDCWLYLAAKGVSVGLISLDPFSVERAKNYIDRFANPPTAGQSANYIEARDLILDRLSGAFSEDSSQFISFIGYPPVLDAVATLFRGEKNYHRLSTELGDGLGGEVEKDLLHRIASYILARERDEKVIPNLVEGLVAELGPEEAREQTREVLARAFTFEEQCARLIGYCCDEQIGFRVFTQPPLNAKYEEGLSTFLSEHPFISGREFRNAVFEAVCIANLIASGDEQLVDLADRYARSRKYNYHLIYLLDEAAPDRVLPARSLHILLGSAMEFKSTKSLPSIGLEPASDAGEPNATVDGEPSSIPITLRLDVFTFGSGQNPRRFSFKSELLPNSSLFLGDKLQFCYIELPCTAVLSGSEIELSAPVVVYANTIVFDSPALVAKSSGSGDGLDKVVSFEGESAISSLSVINVEGADFRVALTERSGHTYPLVKYIKALEEAPFTGEVREKYLKLRKILTHFRSHSKGSLAKYRDKVDNERVAGNELGGRVLARLLSDGVLYASGNFYFLDPDKLHKFLGIPWTALRAGLLSDKLEDYLNKI